MSLYGGIFRLPPQPQQRRSTVPIEAQGDQPPPRQAFAAGMAIILSCWPTGLEHQPQRPRPTVPIPVAVVEQPAFTRQPESIRQSWEFDPPLPTLGVKVAPIRPLR
jgi:hypothetical protein